MRNDDERERGKVEVKQPADSRRRFMVTGVGFVTTAVAGITLAPALKLLAHPLSHDTTTGGNVLIEAGRVKDFGPEPVKVDLYADTVDAWNRAVNVKVGSAWVLERDGELIAMSTVCPHLGCAIDYDEDGKRFVCPCHDSFFDLDGKETEGPSPRSMDRLELEEEERDPKIARADRLVRVKHQRFKQGTPDKEPI